MALKPETEWLKTVEEGWNILADSSEEKITHAINYHVLPSSREYCIFRDGNAAEKIVRILGSILPVA